MKILELFSGTQSISKKFREAGHETFCIEYNELFTKEPYNLNQLTEDILNVTSQYIIDNFGYPDVIWASPDCTSFSVAAIYKHRRQDENGLLIPISDKAILGDKLLNKTIELINELNPKYYFIENPRGAMRKSVPLQGYPRYTLTYCGYGDIRMKPTDIWSNHPNPKFKKACKNGDSCHVSAPRGSKTGTQGLKGALERAVIPEKLCDHIVKICEEMEK